MGITIRRGVALLGSLLWATSALATEQIITIDPSELVVGAEETQVSFDVQYTTNPEGEQTTGIGVNLHYDSSVLEFVSMTLNSDVSDDLGSGNKDEENDEDSDSNTDKVAYVAYASTGGEFPELQFIKDGAIVTLEFPVSLYTITFNKVNASFEGTTTLNFVTEVGPGNSAQADSFGILFKGDEVPPSISLADDVTEFTIEAQGPTTSSENAVFDVVEAAISVSDNKDSLTVEDVIFSSEEGGDDEELFFSVGTTTTVYLRVLDSSGNSDSAEISITMVDTTQPSFAGVGDVTLAATDATGVSADQASVQAYLALITASDSVSGDLTSSIVNNLPAILPLGDTTVSFSVTDSAGNLAETQATISVTDQTAPVIAESATVEGNAVGGFEWTPGAIDWISVVDNVDAAPSINLASSTAALLPIGETLVAVTVTDSASNQSEQSVLVTVVDTTAPVIEGANVEIEGSPGLAVSAQDSAVQNWLASVVANDVVDGQVTVTNNAPDEFPFGVSTDVEFTASDVAGNEASATYSLAVSPDDVLPEISAPASITVEATGPEGALASNATIAGFLLGASASDNVDGDISSSVTTDAPSTFPLGSTTVTFSIKDSSNNEATAEAQVEVVDTTAPVFSGVIDATFAAVDASGTPASALEEFGASITASDLVDGEVEVGDDVPEVFPLGETVVTLTATDSQGNTATETLTVTISDQTNPTVAATDLSVEATEAGGASVTLATLLSQVTASDNVDVEPAVSLDAEEGVFGFGDTVVNVTVTDAASNSATASFTVSVADTTAPAFEGLVNLVLTVEEEQPVASSDERFVAWLDGITAVDVVDGDVAYTTSEIPEEFPVGVTTLTFTTSDSRGNENEESVTIRVAVGPAVLVSDDLTLVSLDGGAVPATQTNINIFLNAASAEDFSGNPLEVTNDAPESFEIGTTVVTFNAVDSDGLEGFNTASVTVIAASAENDTDEDGIDDLYEVDNGLNPNDGADGEADADGDGRNNLDEYLEGKDPNADDVVPVVVAPADVFVDSTGLFTSVDLGVASATDVLDGEITAVASDPGPYLSGEYEITWSATDAAGNVGSDSQRVVIRPLVSTAPKGRTAEGETFILRVALNGDAPEYPVQIPILFGGTATYGEDFEPDNLAEGDVLVISSGDEGTVALSILEDDLDDEGNENIVVSLGDPVANAVLGAAVESDISIVEEAVPPALKLSITQGDSKGKSISTVGGEVIVGLEIIDPNGEHQVDWTGSDAIIDGLEDAADTNVLKFDPSDWATIENSSVQVIAKVTDSGIADSSFTISAKLKVSQAEVEPDSDGDGIPDSKDTSDKPNVIALNADSGSAAASSDEGTRIVTGDTANSSDTAGIGITEETLAESGGDDEDFNYPSGILDFEVQDLAIPGDSVRIVIPLAVPIPEGATFRKFTDEDGWYDFVVDDKNSFATARGDDGACPDLGSDLYVDGLTEGDSCLQLTLEDGGPNDADGEVNGVFKDPSGVAEEAPVQVVIPPDTSQQKRVGGSGGCSVATGPGDFGLVFLLLATLSGMLWRRRKGQAI